MGDRVGILFLRRNRSGPWRGGDRYEKAGDCVDRATEIVREMDAVRNLVRSYAELIRINRRRGDADKVAEIAERGLAVVEGSDTPGLDEERKAFESALDAADESVGTASE